MINTLNKIDIDILSVLQNDSEVILKDLANKIGLSLTPTSVRVKKMLEEGYIKKYVAILDGKKLGFSLVAYCQVKLKSQSKEDYTTFETSILNFPEVVEIIRMYGSFDYLLKIICSDLKNYEEFISNRLSDIIVVSEIHSNIVMKEIKYGPFIPLELLELS